MSYSLTLLELDRCSSQVSTSLLPWSRQEPGRNHVQIACIQIKSHECGNQDES